MEQTKEEIKETKVDETLVQPKEKKGLNLKILLFGIPIFIVQLIAVYFITANFLLNKVQTNHSATETPQVETKKEAAPAQASSKELGKFVFMIEDLIVNPAKTDGKRLLLSSLGFDVSSEKDDQELKSKEVLLKDAVISIMSSKEMTQLSNIAYRDTLRTEIIKRLAQVMPAVKINTIYFSKYILQ
ncbi:MAG: flagellar basal body-associated FliL family protein [Ignavibacteriales bacterium]|nr:flagellar basal body-associated FliL family protein [Ignavibacteriales bacterium]